jgi:peptidoglycan/xylan/chitin deacetylase (PgdA/CDA1 family)
MRLARITGSADGRIRRGLAVALAAVLAVASAAAERPESASAECAVQFGPDLLRLQSAIGDVLGEPVDCARLIDTAGDMIQATSTGMAWDWPADATAMFSDGYHRWELEIGDLIYWDAPDAMPLRLDGLPDGPAVWTSNVICPVLYTHEVPLAAALRQMLRGLLVAGFHPTSFSVVDAAMSGQGEVPLGCVVLSFDDALASQLRNAVPVLAEFNITALFFVMPSFQDGRHQYLDASGIRALHDAGHIVGAHTCSHATLTLLRPDPMRAELSDCKRQVEQTIGVPVRYFAYPNGAVNQAVLAATAEAGYRAAFTTRASATLRADQPLLLPRIRYDPGEAISSVVSRLRAALNRR